MIIRQRIITSQVRRRISRLLILLCLCSIITSFMFRKIQSSLNEDSIPCEQSLPDSWREIPVPGQIRTVRVDLNRHFHPHQTRKTILLWTKYFSEEYSSDFYFFQGGQQTFIQNQCEFNNCFVTSNRSLLPVVDVVLFHARDINFRDIPQRPRTNQIWILYSMEPPRYMLLKWKLIQSLFNWTMTYRSDSDIQVKYGEIFPSQLHRSSFFKHKSVTDRPKDVLWMVSNCKTESRRETYVRELKKFMNVDVYGKCSRKKRCEPPQSEACYKILENYKYYLSFENSICTDYITEKFFNALRYDIVPVVLGGGDYSAVAPRNSFIDATLFSSPEKLSDYLREVESNSSWYDSYFEWKQSFSVHLHPWMCDFCKRLHEPRTNIQTLPEDLWLWWVPRAYCRRWTKKKGFKNIFN